VVGEASRVVRLAGVLVKEGHAVRVVTSDASRREAIERVGAECFLGAPDRLATLTGALEHVTIACWMLADASGTQEVVRALHGPRLERFMYGAIDSTVRGFLYEAGGEIVSPEVLAEGRRIVSETAAGNSIPAATLTADPGDAEAWLEQARGAVRALLEGRDKGAEARYADAYIPKSRSAFGIEASIQEDT
jgi:hypothetical protein